MLDSCKFVSIRGRKRLYNMRLYETDTDCHTRVLSTNPKTFLRPVSFCPATVLRKGEFRRVPTHTFAPVHFCCANRPVKIVKIGELADFPTYSTTVYQVLTTNQIGVRRFFYPLRQEAPSSAN